MATTTKAIQSNTVDYGYLNALDSLYNFNITPQLYASVQDRYGTGLGVFQYLQLAEKTYSVKSDSVRVLERGSLERGVKLDGTGLTASAAPVAGEDITFGIASTEYDSANRCYIGEGDVIVVPGGSMSDGYEHKYQITGVSGSAGSYTFTATPDSKDVKLASQYENADDVLMVTGGNWARGSQGPSQKSSGWYYKDFKTAIKRASFKVEGGTTATERWTDTLKNGDKGTFTKASLEADFFLDSAVNDEIFLGEEIDNLTIANEEGESNSAKGTKGIWPHLVSDGMLQSYVESAGYAISDLADIKDLFRSQGVVNTKASFLVGSGLMRDIEDSGLTFLQDYSGGTDLMKTYGEAGIEFKAFLRNGIMFMLQEVVNFDNPVKYGLSSMDWQNRGMVIPETDVAVKIGGQSSPTITLPNVTLGYLNNNGEDRTRIVKLIPGVEGITGSKFAASTYDSLRGEILTEFMLIFNKRNQCVRVIGT